MDREKCKSHFEDLFCSNSVMIAPVSQLHRNIFQATEEIVAVQAVQVITFVGLKYLTILWFSGDVVDVSYRFSQVALRVEGNDVHLVGDGLAGSGGGDGRGCGPA